MSSPSLVGGIALRAYDLPGAITFAVAYGLLLPHPHLWIFQQRHGGRLFSFRPIVFSLRAAVAARPNTENPGLSEYMQLTFALGYLTLAEILLKLIRTVLVNSTKGTPTSDAEARTVVVTELPPLVSTQSAFSGRFWYRRWCEFLLMLYLVALVVGVVATSHIWSPTEVTWNRAVQALRYTSSSLGAVLIILEICTLRWAQRNVPHINQRAAVTPIYRLIVMWRTTPNISAPDAQALNTQRDKAVFYVFHLLPEFIVVCVLCCSNIRDICQMGFKGDERWRDETPKEREDRERKAREKANKKGAKNASLELKTRNSKTSSNDSSSTLA
ncbi:hypothetical protein MSAN_00792300 [Mycena sanguinolenta]|uniref:Uncharacterized protein n=1 Tax=Mycena sanguinolenta TaxID=230812 RepID=A0A8H7DC09_9AGAR|nr:hypothetical protein MSAN_00792300 [Mycena sanguinolenta]